MSKMICAKKHFGNGGKLIEVGTEANGKPDGVYWVAATGSTQDSDATSDASLEVATPSKNSGKKSGKSGKAGK